MKPDWKDAPEWANWLAIDPDGVWYWFDREPHALHGEWWTEGCRFEHADPESWIHSKEKRPFINNTGEKND